MTDDRPTATCPTCDGEQGRYAVNISHYLNTATRRADRLEAENKWLLAELQAARRVVNIAREFETVLLATDTRPSQADLAAYSAQMRPALVAHDTRLDALSAPAAEPEGDWATTQINRLAQYLLDHYPEEIRGERGEGAVDLAIRLLAQLAAARATIAADRSGE